MRNRLTWILTPVAMLLVAVLVLGGTLVRTAVRSSAGAIDCGESAFSLFPLNPEHAVFTARLIRVAHAARVDGNWGGDWAIGTVEESFWGLPAWAPHFVLLINDIYWENTTVLISGGREKGILTRFLPIVNTSECGYFSYRMPDAKIFVRLLREPPASALNRITGYVGGRSNPSISAPQPSQRSITLIPRNSVPWAKEVYEEKVRGNGDRYTPLPGAIVNVAGLSGSWNFTTDQDGIYLSSDLPDGNYTVRVVNPPANQVSGLDRVGRYGVSHKGFWTRNLYTEWTGTIEGTVRDVAGTPKFAFLRLENAVGTPVSGEISDTRTNDDGSFRFGGVPIGSRFLLRMNPLGPQDHSPYPPLYYPSALDREGARVLEITEKEQHIQNVNFTVKPLVKRTLQIRIKWPNGQSADDGYFCISYDRSRPWEYLHASFQCGSTDPSGMADLPLFGDTPVRVFAYAFLDKDRRRPPDYSKVIEIEPSSLPPNLNLVVTSSDPPK